MRVRQMKQLPQKPRPTSDQYREPSGDREALPHPKNARHPGFEGNRSHQPVVKVNTCLEQVQEYIRDTVKELEGGSLTGA